MNILISVFSIFLFAIPGLKAAEVRVLDAHRMYHLGTEGFAEWDEFKGKKPHGRRVDVKFESAKNKLPQVLLLRQRQVKVRWPVLLNQKRIGYLLPEDPALWHSVTVPAGALVEGENTLSVVSPKITDDIEVGDFQLARLSSLDQILSAVLEVTVTDADTDRSVPCRITIVDEAGTRALLWPQQAKQQQLAHRSGVIYTSSGSACFKVRPGRYTLYASRGFEYSVAKVKLEVADNSDRQLKLKIRREVPTPGLVSVDTHIHTLTRSGHGDSTEEERMHTISGEGIELAIATDHNHHADYRPVQKSSGTLPFFTSVIGNEVTTKTGHFNAFPIVAGSEVPDYKLGDWTKLMASMRAIPGVRVIVLNHPRNMHSKFSPMAVENFNHATGQNRYGAPYSFDAMEVVTSAAMQSDIMSLYRDWFAMLNWGHKVAAVGSSDTHDVSRFILGQARTYVECPDEDPSKVDVARACDSFRNMRAYVSMGLLVKMKVDGKFRSGDLATGKGELKVRVEVLGPSWVRADRVDLFSNGQLVRSQKISPSTKIIKADVNWVLPRPAHDVHLIALATGPGITAPFWESPRPYQPVSTEHNPRVQGATNPVFIDGDNDGKFTAPRLQAQQILKQNAQDLDGLFVGLKSRDQAVAAQVAALLHASGRDLRSKRLLRRYTKNPAIKAGFEAFIKTIVK